MTDQNKNATQPIQDIFQILVIPVQIITCGMESSTDLSTMITILKLAKNKNKESFNNPKT